MKFLIQKLLFVIVLVGIAPSQGYASEFLIGTWQLISVSSKASDGSVDQEPYGANPTGYLTYTEDGFMQVILSFSDRPLLRGNLRDAPPEELAAAYLTSLSYAGRYSYSDGKVTHHIEVSSNPNRVGTNRVRSVTQKENEIVLTTPPMKVGDSTFEISLTWHRDR